VDHATISLLILGAVIVLFVWNRLPANMMVLSPGGYLFGDYWRLGLPLLVAWLVLALLIVPRVWPL
jgi:di/tricarboxylate transporter